MTALLALAALSDLSLVVLLGVRVSRSWSRGLSLRLRIFLALAGATLVGALATGLYAVAVEAETLGFAARAARVAPKAFLLASAFVGTAAVVAAWVGARLARPVEVLSLEAARIAEGEPTAAVRSGRGVEARRLAKALTTMRREIADRPYAAAFLRDAWHDLKTPVAAIVATLEVLDDGAVDDPEAARRFLQNLRRSADQLDRRLQDFVTLARFETGAVADGESVDFVELVRDAVVAATPMAQARGVTVELEEASQARVRGEAAALSRAIGNLLDNAVRASPGGRVRVAFEESSRELCGLSIANEPAVVPADVRGRLFQRAATGGADGGTGLGLAIARAAIETHGGQVRFVELGPPRVVVSITLPRA
jgi:signal transduction histidine kinase